MMRKLEAFFLFAAIAAWESNAEIVANRGMRDEAKQLRGIASNLKQMRNISESNMRAETDELKPLIKFRQTDAAAFQQDEALRKVKTHEEEKTFAERLEMFWGSATEKISKADTYNGYVSGVLLVYDPTSLAHYEAAGGLGLVYLSYAGLALGMKDNAEKMSKIWKYADQKECSSEVMKNGAGLTINVIAQGAGIAALLGAGPVGGAVLGLVSVAVAESGEQLLDLMEDEKCDDWLKTFKADIEIKVGKATEIPEVEPNEDDDTEFTYKKSLTWSRDDAAEISQNWYDPSTWTYNPLEWKWSLFHQNMTNGSFYAVNGRNFSNGKRRNEARHVD